MTSDEVVELDRFRLADVPAHLAGEDDEQPAVVRMLRALDRRDRTSCVFGGGMSIGLRGTNAGLCGARGVERTPRRWMRDPAHGDRVAPLSYWIFAPFSYARLVVTLATRFAFDRLDIARMEIYVEIDNRASNAVAASAGFVREGVLRSQSTVAGRRRDMALYARLAGGHGEVR